MSLKQKLKQFYGTEHYYQTHPLIEVFMTDGVRYFADRAEAHWLIGEIALNRYYKLKQEDFIVVKTRNTSKGVVVQYEDGNNNVLMTDQYSGSSLPEDGKYTLWVEQNVILLPSEH